MKHLRNWNGVSAFNHFLPRHSVSACVLCSTKGHFYFAKFCVYDAWSATSRNGGEAAEPEFSSDQALEMVCIYDQQGERDRHQGIDLLLRVSPQLLNMFGAGELLQCAVQIICG